MRLLVCGGRDYNDNEAAFAALDAIHRKRGITCIIEGGATGADTLARQWAASRAIDCRTFYANWNLYGKAAGPLRNAQMLDEGRPDGVLALPGGRGTADMVKQAEASGIKVWRPYG